MPQVIRLSDGPHNLIAPTGYVLRELQRKGYPTSEQFSMLSLMTNTKRGEPKKVKGELLTPVVIADESKPQEFDLTAISDHIAATMRDPEWDSDRVADLLVIDELPHYFEALRSLADEAFGGEPDPKASNGSTPASPA